MVQQTKYPEEAATHLTIQEIKEGNLPLYIRYPSWATSDATITINGKNIKISRKPGSYIVLNRNWRIGDKIDITFPMSLHLVATNDNPNMAAIVYGPIVLAGDMGTDGMEAPAPFAKDQLDYRNLAVPDNIISTLNINGRELNEWLIPVSGKPLVFKTA